MQKWDFLSIVFGMPTDHSVRIESTDPDEITHFQEIFNKTYSAKVAKIWRESERSKHRLEFNLVDAVTNKFSDVASGKDERPYVRDVFYSFIIDARERGWQPCRGFTKFVRYTEEAE